MLFDETDRKELARILHSVNNLVRKQTGEEPLRFRDSNVANTMDGLEYCLNKCETRGQMDKGELHSVWMMDKLNNGWKHGPVMSRKKKQHPNIVPFDYLPMEQREKDNAFWNIIQNIYIHCHRTKEIASNKAAKDVE